MGCGRWVWLGVLALLAACEQSGVDCKSSALRFDGVNTCTLPGWDDRNFNLHIPAAESANRGVIVFFHGGSGSKKKALNTTCPGGDDSSSECLLALAQENNYIVAVPDGTKPKVLNLRTFNAGGGVGNFRCTSGRACEENVNDVKYFEDLIDEIERITNIDRDRIFLTGISNGGAISYRLACERADQVAAIAPVSGANQAAVAPGCAPSRPVPLLHIHGTADPTWKYDGGEPDTSFIGQPGKEHVGVEASVSGGADFASWTELMGCNPDFNTEDIPDTVDDGTRTEVRTWSGCDQDVPVKLVKITGGGHTWPQGDQYLGEATIGRVAQDFSANRMIIDFFNDVTRPAM